jgi:hypothetical protein
VGRKSRIIGYGGSLLLVALGTVVAVVRTDTLGMASAVALVSIGLIAATSLVFYEVGLSEDRDRARESAGRRRSDAADREAATAREAPPPDPRRRLVRPQRTRGSR